MTAVKVPKLHPKYLTAESGHKQVVQLSRSEYDRLVKFLDDLEDIIDLEKARVEPEETIEIADFWAKVETGGQV